VLLTLLYRPLFTKLDAFKLSFLVTVRRRTRRRRPPLTPAGRRARNPPLGLVPDPQPHMELPQPRRRRAHAARHPPRGGLLLLHPDVQHVAAVPHPLQAHLPARLSARRHPGLAHAVEAPQDRRTAAPSGGHRVGLAARPRERQRHLCWPHRGVGCAHCAAAVVGNRS
jgi:hypothetical protein